MITYISMLRGINVSGQKIINMVDLKKMYEKLDFAHIQTYRQSGNVIFAAKETSVKDLEKVISSQIRNDFGFDVPVIVLQEKTLQAIVENNPLAKDHLKDPSFLHVTFLGDPPAEFDREKIIDKKHPSEEVIFTTQAVYLYCPNGYGKTKLNNSFLENQLQVSATTRNWKTTNELLKRSHKAD